METRMHAPVRSLDQGSVNPARAIRSSATSHSQPQSLYMLRKHLGNRAFGQLLQAKLQMGSPGDPYEREADQAADTVMRMAETNPKTAVHGEFAESGSRFAALGSFEEDTVRRMEDGSAALELSSRVEQDIASLRGGGMPMPEDTRNFFESRFGYDFSQVRIHADSRAGETAKAIQAKAFTVGSDIAFAPGQYSPQTMEGRRLLAHELAHVIQQTGGTPKTEADHE